MRGRGVPAGTIVQIHVLYGMYCVHREEGNSVLGRAEKRGREGGRSDPTKFCGWGPHRIPLFSILGGKGRGHKNRQKLTGIHASQHFFFFGWGLSEMLFWWEEIKRINILLTLLQKSSPTKKYHNSFVERSLGSIVVPVVFLG